MKILDNILYIEFSDFIAAGWNESTVLNANFRNGAFWIMTYNPDDKRKPLVQYDTLRNQHKEKLQKKFGNPYEHIAKQPIKKLIETDFKAEQFYRDYRYDTDKYLPVEHQLKYTKAASWLNMLIKLNDDKKIIKQELNIRDITKFWLIVTDIIKADNVELPTSYRKLLEKIKDYKECGYETLISGKFGNKNPAKVGKSTDGFDKELYNKQVAFIRKASSKHQNYDAQQITSAVNEVFKKQGWAEVSKATVYNIIQANTHLTLAGSRGKREYNNKISMQRKRKRPDYPLYYLTLDGWTVELLYQDKNTFHNRLVVVVVLDAMNNYPLGYAIGERENTELIRQANRNASLHINELFGDYYQPKQLQSDHYGLKNLTPFYQSMAHLHTPAAVGNAKSKVIEPYFKDLNKNYCQRFPNWSGFNLNSKKSNQPNTEFLDKIKHSFPDKAGVINQIEMIITQERKNKIAAYLQAWQSLDASEKIAMNKMDMLMVYGKPTNYTNSITGMGLTVSLKGEKITYDSFDPQFRALQHLKWNVIYDESDLSSILVINEEKKRRFVLDTKRLLPMDIHSTTDADRAYDRRIQTFNKNRMEEVMQQYIIDDSIVSEVMGNTVLNLDDFNEASLKLMFTNKGGQQKEAIQDAKGLPRIKTQSQVIATQQKEDTDNWNEIQREYLQSKTDFNQYLD